MKNLFLLNIIAILFLLSCKKPTDDLMAPAPPSYTNPTVSTPVVPTSEMLKDSSLSIARNIYLWNENIPLTFNARSYSDFSGMMTAIRAYSNEPGFSQPVDKWSFAMKKNEWDQMSGGMGNNFSNSSSTASLGFQVFFRAEGDLRVRYVEPLSAAGRAGMRRGWKVVAINGNNNITTGNASFIIQNIYNSSSVTLSLVKPDGSQANLNLTAFSYAEKPVYLDTIYNNGAERTGYLVFNSFLGNTSQVRSEFARVFNKFSAQNITSLIIDLRYNGGGYVSLQEDLANYIINNISNGQVMMKQVFNSQNSHQNVTTTFSKKGSVNLQDIYFIVGRGTASASELLINNLKPYMNVKLLGASNTHGKPVGYFPIPLGEWYLFPVSFKTLNKNGEGNYYQGIAVNAQVADGLDKDWGDVNETSLASALRHISSGYFRDAPYYEPTAIARGNEILETPHLKITVDNR